MQSEQPRRTGFVPSEDLAYAASAGMPEMYQPAYADLTDNERRHLAAIRALHVAVRRGDLPEFPSVLDFEEAAHAVIGASLELEKRLQQNS